ncbi:MAG TPA: SLC13 family permease [Pseudomonadales bacterium]|nr:SLC13 family permease [Pseudomonadales bacterium]
MPGIFGKSIIEAGLRHLQRIYLAEIERRGHILTAVTSEERLEGGDRLVFVGETDAIIDVLRINGLVASEGAEPVIERNAPERRLVEVVISPECECIGQTIRDSQFRSRYGAVVLAVARGGRHIKGNLGSIELQTGDLLLLEARPSFIARQHALRDFLVINDLNEERPNHDKAPISWAILLGVIGLASFELLDMLNAALLGAGLMILTRCCSASEARRSLDLPVLITIGASLALGKGLEKSGAAEMLAQQLMTLASGDPWLLLALSYFTVMLLTELITNNAAAAIMLPIVLAMCGPLGLDPVPFTVAVMFAASASFATPLGYQTNMMVYGPGGYQFSDFLRMGAAMNLIVGAVTVLLIPLFWPLQAG